MGVLIFKLLFFLTKHDVQGLNCLCRCLSHLTSFLIVDVLIACLNFVYILLILASRYAWRIPSIIGASHVIVVSSNPLHLLDKPIFVVDIVLKFCQSLSHPAHLLLIQGLNCRFISPHSQASNR